MGPAHRIEPRTVPSALAGAWRQEENMNITEMRPEDLTPYPANAKQHPPEQVRHIANSIREFGFRQPIVVDRDNVVVIGHGRLMAAKELCLETVPVVKADDLTDEQIRALRLADNKTNESDWDFTALEAELAELELEFDMTQFGFDGVETADVDLSEVQEDEPPESPEEPSAKLGDIYQLGEHRLMCGDSTNVDNMETLLDGEFMRLTVTSPPYGVGKDYEEKGIGPWRKTIGGVIDAIKGKTLIICWNIIDLFSTGNQFTEPTGAYSVQMMSEAGYGMLYNRIWKKPGANFAGNNPYYTVTTKPALDYEYLYAFAEKDTDRHLQPLKNYLFREAQKANLNNDTVKSIGGPGFMCGHWFTEHQWSFIDEKNYKRIQKYCAEKSICAFERDYGDVKSEYLRNTVFSHALTDKEFSDWGLYGVWEFNTVHERLGGHAAAYPVELPTRFIKMHSYDGDSVLDPFGGTGTTLIACEQTGRRCYLMELDPHYVDVIIARWEKLTGQKAVRLN